MTVEVNIRDYPYFDLYDRESRYTKILPYVGGTTQPRDLIEAQSMIQDQITRLANTIYANGTIIDGCKIDVSADKTRVTISPGHVYLDGQIEEFLDTTILMVSGVGLEVIGLVKTEEIITDTEDPTLKNPATNFDYYDPAGSYRIKTTWAWDLLGEDTPGVVIKTINVSTIVDGAVTTTPTSIDTTQVLIDRIMKIIADRDYAQLGNYVLDGLDLKLVDHPQYKWDMKQIVVTSGTARIQGIDIKRSVNWLGNLSVARDTRLVQNETWFKTNYDAYSGTGGQRLLGERPIASVRSVVASVLVVDGYGERPTITRGPIRGGSDRLSNPSVTDIVEICQGGVWNPLTEHFVGGYVFPSQSYMLDGNKVNWSPVGVEPESGSSYSVAYKFRSTLAKQLMKITLVENEVLIKDETEIIANPYICETNQYTGLEFKLTNQLASDESVSDYIKDTDFSVLIDGHIDWYNHRVQELVVTRSSGTSDTLDLYDIPPGYSVESILGIASTDGEFSSIYQIYTLGSTIYRLISDYLVVNDVDRWLIDWSPNEIDSVQPIYNYPYKVAVLVRAPKSDSHPDPGDTYYATYNYWEVAVAGDYTCRDSFYSVYDAETPSLNKLQHYGLDLQDSVNFWRSSGNQNNLGNMDKPYPGTLVEFDYDYYMSKYAVINFTRDATISVSLGTSSENPTEPVFDENSSGIMLGTVYMPADGLNMVLHKFGVSTLKTADLQNIKTKLIQAEQDLADTWLDMSAKNLPVSNKKGISTSSFRSDDLIDKGWPNSRYSIDPDWEQLTLPHTDSFYSTEIDTNLSTGAIYGSISTIAPVGVEVTSQASYTGSVSLSPYVFSDQSKFLESQFTTMNLFPSGDSLVIPRVSTSSVTDSDIWSISDISKLNDPSPWFSGGWRGNQEDDQKTANLAIGYQTIKSDIVTQNWTRLITSSVDGNCRQIQVTFRIDGGLPDPNSLPIDFFLYFGGVLVEVTPIEGTPVGSVSGTFRPKVDRTAAGTFIIPLGISAGKAEVKAVSSPCVLNGADWRYVSSSIFSTSVSEVTTKMFDKCRCNCYSCNRCANCWSCSGRCGTGPLSETLRISDRAKVLRSLEIDYFSVSPIYGTYASIVSTENGQPTSNTIANSMLGRKYLSPLQLVGAGPKLHTFDDPIFVKNDTYAILVTAEDGFNLNSRLEVASGRDIRVKVSKIGNNDLITGLPINSKPFRSGALWNSQTGETWVEDDTTDLKFKASFNVYPINTAQTIQMSQVDVSSATAFLCTWDSQIVEGTSIVFQYTIGDGTWIEFSPYVLTRLSTPADQIIVRAILMTSSSSVSPFVENKCGMYTQSKNDHTYVVTRLFSLAEGESADSLDIWVDSHLPSEYTQKFRVTFDEGVNWVDLDQSDGGLTGIGFVVTFLGTIPVNLNVGEEAYTYHWNITLPPGTHYTSFRTEINLNSILLLGQSTTHSPTLSNYIAISSNL